MPRAAAPDPVHWVAAGRRDQQPLQRPAVQKQRGGAGAFRSGPSSLVSSGSVGGLEGVHHGLRDPAAVGDLVAVLPGPRPDRRGLLPVQRLRPPDPSSRSSSAPGARPPRRIRRSCGPPRQTTPASRAAGRRCPRTGQSHRPGRRWRTRPCPPHPTRRGRRRTSRSLAAPCMLPFQSCRVVSPPIMHIPTSTGKLADLGSGPR